MAADSIGDAVRTRRAKGLQFAFALTAAVVLLRSLPVTSGLPVFSLIENFAYDFYFQHRPVRDMSRFVIIAIDEESLLPEHLGRFPWPRSAYAALLPRLAQADAVGVDLLFSEPSPEDAALAKAMQRHGRVVLAAHKRRVEKGAIAWQGYGQHDVGRIPVAHPGEEFVPPVPLLAKAAAGIGYVDIVPDRDGIYRRVEPLEVGKGGYLYPHFSCELARLVTKTAPAELVSSAAQGNFTIGPRQVPLSQGRMLINYAGPVETVTYLPFWKVLAGQYGPETFRNKIVLIGPTAAGLYDIRPAPFARNNRVFFGVETNANIAATLLSGEVLRDFRGSPVWALYALLVGMLTACAIWNSRDALAAVLGVMTVAFLALPAFFVGVALLHQVVPYGGIVLAAVLPMAVALYERLGAEKREVTRQFATYVSPDVLHELAENPELVRAGQRREVTILFSDVRGSTTIAENMEPDVWIAQLNEYLSEMSDAIFAYDGYLDKFMGDGIMVLWNAFGNQPDHAQLATKSALQMLERLRHLNEQWEHVEGRVPLRIGIGLHTGEVIVGNVGSNRRAQYTAIGDSVNTASRLEALTKDFGAEVLLSETTAAAVEQSLQLVELGEARLKGREKPLKVYKPHGYQGEMKGSITQEHK
ncbi:MAG: adenylate/guanylate cyclase domain-containing protein [Armatimonadia bacterium]